MKKEEFIKKCRHLGYSKWYINHIIRLHEQIELEPRDAGYEAWLPDRIIVIPYENETQEERFCPIYQKVISQNFCHWTISDFCHGRYPRTAVSDEIAREYCSACNHSEWLL